MSNRNRWYFYNGRVPVPVRLLDGRVYAVRPRGHVYTTADGVRKYGNKFRPCGAPANAEEILKMLSIETEKPPTLAQLKESATSPISRTVVELGRAVKGSPPPEPPKPASVADGRSPRKRTTKKRRDAAKSSVE